MDAPGLVANVFTLGGVLAVGRWGLLKLDVLRDKYAEDRLDDQSENAEERAKLRAEMRDIERHCLAKVDEEIEGLRGAVQQLDRNVERVLEVVKGSEFHPDGLLSRERRATSRRHELIRNISKIDAKLILVTGIIANVARQANVSVDPQAERLLKQPIDWQDFHRASES